MPENTESRGTAELTMASGSTRTAGTSEFSRPKYRRVNWRPVKNHERSRNGKSKL
jgi:hypothetical protein